MRAEKSERFDDPWLDKALKTYGAAEPRTGLEGRVLARLNAQNNHSALWSWSRWAAAALVVTTCGALLINRKTPPTNTAIVTNHSPSAASGTSVRRPAPPAVQRQAAHKRPNIRQPRPTVVLASEPRQEQFPTPRPLTEQEQMLARYVRERQEEATMVARARAELLQQDLQKFAEEPPSSAPARDLQE